MRLISLSTISHLTFALLATSIMLAGCGDRRGDTLIPAPGPGPGPTPVPGPTTVCEESCSFSADGDCDDGGEGSMFSVCELGSDCMDCGPRTVVVGSDAGASDAGGTGSDGSTGCGTGCPAGQSCVLDECIDNGTDRTDSNTEGGSCECDGSGAADVYKTCSGTSDGCMGFGGSGQLVCLAGEMGDGLCRYPCNETDEGAQGDCPDGWTCQNSGRRSLTESFWYTCTEGL